MTVKPNHITHQAFPKTPLNPVAAYSNNLALMLTHPPGATIGKTAQARASAGQAQLKHGQIRRATEWNVMRLF